MRKANIRAVAGLFRVGILGIFTAVTSVAAADPIALDWEPGCINSSGDFVAKAAPGIACLALDILDGASSPIPYETPLSYAATLTRMQHIELFPIASGESDFVLGAIAFEYMGAAGDTIQITGGALSDENGQLIAGTNFSGAVDAGAAPKLSFPIPIFGIQLPIQGCGMINGFACTVLFPIAGAIFHDIHFTLTVLQAECEPAVEPCVRPTPTIEPIGALFFRKSLLSDNGSMPPVGTVGDWVAISEPATLGLLGFALAGLGFARRRFSSNHY